MSDFFLMIKLNPPPIVLWLELVKTFHFASRNTLWWRWILKLAMKTISEKSFKLIEFLHSVIEQEF